MSVDVRDLLPCRWPEREGYATVCTADRHHADCPASRRREVVAGLADAWDEGAQDGRWNDEHAGQIERGTRSALPNPYRDDVAAAPPFDPDEELMADVEGSTRAVAAYKREAAILRAIDRSSLGTPEAKALRAQTSDAEVAKVMARLADLDNGCTCSPHSWWRLGQRDCPYHTGSGA